MPKREKKSTMRRCTIGVLVGTLLVSIPTYAVEAPKTILEERQDQSIAPGLKIEEVGRLTNKGWVNYVIMRMDTSNKDLELEVVQTEEPYGKRDKLTTMSSYKDIIAAVNGDFYISYLKETDTLGITLDNNKLIAGFDMDHVLEPGQFTLMQDLMGNFNIGDLGINYYLVNSKGKKMDLGAYNKISSVHIPTYIDQKVMKDTSGMDELYDGIYKIIVEDGVITKITKNTDTVKVPENGYVITMNYNYYAQAIKIFEEGQTVFTVPKGTVDLEDLEFAFSGGGQILKDGNVVAEPGLEVGPDKRHPRSAVGLSQDKKTMIMIALDGRGASIGATGDELAQIMKDEGAYDAMLLDGGGSTEMIYKAPGSASYTIANKPSEGKERSVANGLGVINNAPKVDKVGSIKFNLADDIYYVGSTIEINPTVLDVNYHKMPLYKNQVKLSLSGVDGFVEDNKVYPLSSGKATIKMNYGNFETQQEVYVINKDTVKKEESEVLGTEGYKMAFVGSTAGKNSLLDHVVQKKIISTVNEKADMVQFVGATEIDDESMNIPFFKWENKFTVTDFDTIRMIQLATDKGGITKTDPYQWSALEQALETNTGDVVFITMNKNPLKDVFIDYKEKEMLQERLSNYVAKTGKKVFVISGNGYTTTEEEIKGVNYVNLNGLWYKAQGESLDLQQSFYMVLFNVNKEEISFSIEPLYNNK